MCSSYIGVFSSIVFSRCLVLSEFVFYFTFFKLSAAWSWVFWGVFTVLVLSYTICILSCYRNKGTKKWRVINLTIICFIWVTVNYQLYILCRLIVWKIVVQIFIENKMLRKRYDWGHHALGGSGACSSRKFKIRCLKFAKNANRCYIILRSAVNMLHCLTSGTAHTVTYTCTSYIILEQSSHSDP
jgi:hypothetical protein